MLVEAEGDEGSLASAHTPPEEVEDSEQEEVQPRKRPRTAATTSTVASSPAPSERDEDSGSSSPDLTRAKVVTPLRAVSPAGAPKYGAPKYAARLNVTNLLSSDDEDDR